jgi:type III pantothenate kinase
MPPLEPGGELVAVNVGNTRTRIGVFRDRELQFSEAVMNADPDAVAAAISGAAPGRGVPIVVASVNNPVADLILEKVEGSGRPDVYRFGKDLTIPIQNALIDDSTVGQDRLLTALGAFSRAKQACIVIDAGTAVTVDFVDGQGVFQGGAIAPGLNMMLTALHEHTAALPSMKYEPLPEGQTFGKDTRGAMALGVQAAILGMVRVLAERYAEFFGAYPQIIATGGDARALFEGDDLVEHIVPDLTLIGIEAACRMQLGLDQDEMDTDL